MTCLLLAGCSSASKTYTYKDTMTLPADFISAEEDIDLNGEEEMTLYYSGDDVTSITDTIEYTFDAEVSADDKDTIKGLLLDSFNTEEEGITVTDKSNDNMIAVEVSVDLKKVDKGADIIQMYNMSEGNFNEDGTYPLETLENALVEAGYEK